MPSRACAADGSMLGSTLSLFSNDGGNGRGTLMCNKWEGVSEAPSSRCVHGGHAASSFAVFVFGEAGADGVE